MGWICHEDEWCDFPTPSPSANICYWKLRNTKYHPWKTVPSLAQGRFITLASQKQTQCEDRTVSAGLGYKGTPRPSGQHSGKSLPQIRERELETQFSGRAFAYHVHSPWFNSPLPQGRNYPHYWDCKNTTS